jgi:type IV secretory pathway VirB10-like protein
MSRVPSIQWFGVLCGIAMWGCSNATPPQPKPEPPKAAVVAPAEPAKVEPAKVETAVKPAAQATPAAASAPAATPDVKQPATAATPADRLASLRQALATASDKNARVLVIDDMGMPFYSPDGGGRTTSRGKLFMKLVVHFPEKTMKLSGEDRAALDRRLPVDTDDASSKSSKVDRGYVSKRSRRPSLKVRETLRILL